ncbi:MAG: nucleotidyltransferase [Flavisolibacter sp.]|nr:nucleotidyltransferase [Flavisolibacter sp.]
MDLFNNAFIQLWQCLNDAGVRYIVVGEFATNFHGYQRYTGDVNLYIEDTPENRKRLRQAYATYGMGDYQIFETTPFIPGWVDFPLQNGVRLDIMTALKGVELSFDECLHQAPVFNVEGVQFHCLHINHLIANKKAVNRPKDHLDVLELEKIKSLKDNTGA